MLLYENYRLSDAEAKPFLPGNTFFAFLVDESLMESLKKHKVVVKVNLYVNLGCDKNFQEGFKLIAKCKH